MPNTGKLIVFAVLLVAHFAAAQTRTHQNFDRDWKFGFGMGITPKRISTSAWKPFFQNPAALGKRPSSRVSTTCWCSLHLPRPRACAAVCQRPRLQRHGTRLQTPWRTLPGNQHRPYKHFSRGKTGGRPPFSTPI